MATNVSSSAPRRRLAPEERRRRILDAAVEVFAERGYEAASMTEIAGRAGVVASVIYDHFPSKRDLYIELLELEGRALIARSVTDVRDAAPRERARLSLEAFFGFVEEDPFAWRFLFRQPPTDPKASEAYRRIRDQATEAIATTIATVAPDVAAPVRVPRELAARMLAEAARAATDGLAGWWYEHRDVPREQVVAIAMSLLWEGFEGLLAAGSSGSAG